MYVRIALATVMLMVHWGCGNEAVDGSPPNASSEPDVGLVNDEVSQAPETDTWYADIPPDEWMDHLVRLSCLDDNHERLVKGFGARDMGMRFIVLGQAEASSIDIADDLGGDHIEQWAFAVCKSQEVTIEALSSEIDPVIMLMRDHGLDNSDYIALDNDSGDGFNARIVVNLEIGFYRVGVWSDDTIRQMFGSYIISVR